MAISEVFELSAEPSLRDTALSLLVASARAGDRDAFTLLYERHVRFVRGVLLSLAEPDDVPDLVQEVFLAAFSKLETLKDPAAFSGWLGMIARNSGRMYLRQRRPNISLVEDLPADERSIDDSLDAARVLAVIKRLPEKFSEPLLLRLVEGMSGPEIADHLGISHASARVNLHRGMLQLKEMLGANND